MKTFATSGDISTQYFGDKFDANKMDGNIHIWIDVNVPPSVKGDQNTTLMFDIKKETMKGVSDNDKMKFIDDIIDADLTHWSKNFTKPAADRYYIGLDRKVRADDINEMDLDVMPGFRLTWNHNKHVEPEDRFSNQIKSKQFVR